MKKIRGSTPSHRGEKRVNRFFTGMQHSTSDKKTNVYLGLLTRLKYSLRLGGYCGLLDLFTAETQRYTSNAETRGFEIRLS